jgi:hypothetical protein
MANTASKIYINGVEADNTLKGLAAKAAHLRNELRALEVGTDAYSKKTSEWAAVTAHMSKEQGKLNDQLRAYGDNIRSKSSSLISNFKGIGVAAAAAFVVDKVLTYGDEINKLAIQVDTYNRKTKIVFGEASRTVEEGARQQAAEIGIARSEYQKLATEMGDLLVPMGYTRQEAAAASVEVMHLAGALAEWSGGQYNVAETSKSVQKAMTGEYEELERYGVKLSAEIVQTRLAAEGKAKLTGRAMENAKAHAILAIMTEKSADALTAFAANEDSLARQNSRLKASFETIKESLVQGLLPILERGTTALANMIAPQRTQIELLKEEQVKTNVLADTLKRKEITDNARKKIAEEFNGIMQKYHLPNLLSEKSTLIEIEAAQKAANAEYFKKITLMSMEDALKEKSKALLNVKSKEIDLQIEHTKASDAYNNSLSRQDALQAEISGSLEGGMELSKQAISDNIAEQQKLQKEMDNTVEAAKKMGIDVQKALTPVTFSSGKTGSDKPKEDKTDSVLEAQKRQLEQLKANIKSYNYDIAQLQMTDDEKEQSRIKEKYEKQIETAKELIKSKYPKVKAEAEQLLLQLQAQFDQEIINLSLKQQAEYDAEMERLHQERIDQEAAWEAENALKRQKDLQDIQEFTNTKNTNELFELETQYNHLLAIAEREGIETTDIKAAYARKQAEITKKANAERLKEEKQTIEAIKEAEVNLKITRLNAMEQGVGMLRKMVGESSAISKALLLFEKGLAIAQIRINLGAEKSAIALKYAKVPGGEILAALGIAQATLRANISTASVIASVIPTFAQKAKGGYHNVMGQDDKRNYHAQFIGQRSTGMLPAHPSLVIAGERGPEYFVDNETLSTPQGGWHVRALENIRQGRAGQLPQFAEGGYTSATPAQVPTNGMVMVASAELSMLNNTLTMLNNILNGGLSVHIGHEKLMSMRKEMSRLDNL